MLSFRDAAKKKVPVPDPVVMVLLAQLMTLKALYKVDARYAPIEVGDLLTMSTTTGHAVKATDPSSSFGAVIGKAPKPRKTGTLLVPTLTLLQ